MIFLYNNEMPQFLRTSAYGADFTKEDYDKALALMADAVQDERHDELLYDYLSSVAPTQEEKDVIRSIRNDERNHREWFRAIYRYYVGKEIEPKSPETFTRPSSYLDGIGRAIFGELGALEKYRLIREGLPSRYHRDVVFRILTDEMKHSVKYNYILNKNALKTASTVADPPYLAAPTVPVSDFKTPDDWVKEIQPLVERALEERREGINAEYLFQKYLLSGVLIGMGEAPAEAVNQVETWEKTGESKLLAQSKTQGRD